MALASKDSWSRLTLALINVADQTATYAKVMQLEPAIPEEVPCIMGYVYYVKKMESQLNTGVKRADQGTPEHLNILRI